MTIRRKLAIFILSSVKKWVEKGDVGPEPSKNTGCGNNWGELDGFMGLLC
jgi:hypothetical protein